MKEYFADWKPNAKPTQLLGTIQEVLTSYEAQGYRLTLRQLYFILAKEKLPYKRVGFLEIMWLELTISIRVWWRRTFRRKAK